MKLAPTPYQQGVIDCLNRLAPPPESVKRRRKKAKGPNPLSVRKTSKLPVLVARGTTDGVVSRSKVGWRICTLGGRDQFDQKLSSLVNFLSPHSSYTSSVLLICLFPCRGEGWDSKRRRLFSQWQISQRQVSEQRYRLIRQSSMSHNQYIPNHYYYIKYLYTTSIGCRMRGTKKFILVFLLLSITVHALIYQTAKNIYFGKCLE